MQRVYAQTHPLPPTHPHTTHMHEIIITIIITVNVRLVAHAELAKLVGKCLQGKYRSYTVKFKLKVAEYALKITERKQQVRSMACTESLCKLGAIKRASCRQFRSRGSDYLVVG